MSSTTLQRLELALRTAHDEATAALGYAQRLSQDITDIVYPVEKAARLALVRFADAQVPRKRPRQCITQEQYEIQPGDLVDVLRDNGATERMATASLPWQLGHGDWVISLDKISGGFDLARVTPVKGENHV